MNLFSIDKTYPSLALFPLEKQREILERARRKTFTAKGNSGKWVCNFVVTLLLGFGTLMSIRYLFNIEIFLVPEILTALALGLVNYYFYRNNVKLITPQVNEIAESERKPLS